MSASVDGPHLLRDVWAFAGVSIVVMFLRILARARIKKFSWDDMLMAFALTLALVGSAILTIAVRKGYGSPIAQVSKPSTVILYDYIGQTFGIAGGVAGRVAFVIFILGILGVDKRDRVTLWAFVGGQVVINPLFILIVFLQCPGHASAILSHSDDAEKCWDLRVQTYYGYFQGAFNSATDLYLAAFSAYISWNLNLKWRVKIGLIILLGLGIFAMVASIIKTIQLHILSNANNNPTRATVDLERWLYIETYLVIISASIPLIRPLFRSGTAGHDASYPQPSHSRSRFTSGTHESMRTGMGPVVVGRGNFSKLVSDDDIPLRKASIKAKSDEVEV